MTPDSLTTPSVKLLKVEIPLDLHRFLHSLKLLTGQPCSRIVERALAVYLARPEMEEGKRMFVAGRSRAP